MGQTRSWISRARRWRLKDQPLSVQFLLAGGIVGVFSILTLGLLLQQVNRQADASRWVAQTHRTMGRLNLLGRDFYGQQTHLKDYLKTGEARYIASVGESRQLFEDGFDELRKLVSHDAEQRAAMQELHEGYLRWLELAHRLMSGKKVTENVARQELSLFKDTFRKIDQMVDRESRRLSQRDRSEKSAIQLTFTGIAVMNIALLLVFGVALAKLYVSIARPISELSRGIQKYQDGQFETRVSVDNQSEIGFLGRSFNTMAGKIELMVRDLRKLDELKSEFLSTISHELRTPLTSIQGYATLVASGDAGEVNGTQKEFLGIIQSNCARLGSLINDLLDVEKIEAGRAQLRKEPLDLAPLLKECHDTFAVVARQKGLKLHYEVPDTGLPVLGDRARLAQVFVNLLSNAIKYTPEGTVELSAERNPGAVVIRVRDTGLGISKEEQERLFQKFYRARSGLDSGESGTGLGLVIARGWIESQGGTIHLQSEPGKGSVFTVTLPLGSESV